jgi:hypothetical protein
MGNSCLSRRLWQPQKNAFPKGRRFQLKAGGEMLRILESKTAHSQSTKRANKVRPYDDALRATEGGRPYNAIHNAGITQK